MPWRGWPSMAKWRCRQKRADVRRRGWLALLLFSLGLTGCFARADPLARIQEAGLLRVALDPSFPPFEFVDETNQSSGLDVDLARALAEQLGVEAHFVTTTYDGLYDALIVGRADVIISALYPDPTRTRDFVFSTPYFNAGEMLVAPSDAGIAGPADLAGRRVAVVFGADGHMAALEWEATLAIYQSAAEALAALAAGEVEAAVVDGVTARAAAKSAPLFTLLVTDEPYVIAARREDAALIDRFDAILDTLRGDGTLEALLDRWIVSEP